MNRSYYATPWELRYRPWALDFTPDDTGAPAFPLDHVVNPYHTDSFRLWTTDDWDPALRFWTRPFDPQLAEWLRATDPSRASTAAALEFGAQYARWSDPEALGWLESADLAWRPDEALRAGGGAAWAASKAGAWGTILAEIEELKQLMQDDRERYLPEIEMQADGVPDYVMGYVGIGEARRPWTVELISAALAISNMAYMYYKGKYKRVRPSTLCPGLTPSLGPPSHPAFPSGHSFAGHLIALFLLEIPAIAERYGLFAADDGSPGAKPANAAALAGTAPLASPLLWLAQRLAKNRERLGVHYASDSTASRHLAAHVWEALFVTRAIDSPTLRSILAKAMAEW